MVDFSRLTLASLQAPGGVLSGASDLAKTLVSAPGQRIAAENDTLRLNLSQKRFDTEQEFNQQREGRIAEDEDQRIQLQRDALDARKQSSGVDPRLMNQMFGLQSDVDVLTRGKQDLAAELAKAQAGVDAAQQKAAEKLGKDIDKRVNSEYTKQALSSGLPLIGKTPEENDAITLAKQQIKTRMQDEINQQAGSSSDVKAAMAALQQLQAEQGKFDPAIQTKQQQLEMLRGLMAPPEQDASNFNMFRPLEGLLNTLGSAADSLMGLQNPAAAGTPQGLSEEERTAAVFDSNGVPPEDPSVDQIIQSLGGETPGSLSTDVPLEEAAEQKNAIFADLRDNPASRTDMINRTLPSFSQTLDQSVTTLRGNINHRQQRRRMSVEEKEKLERAVPPTIRTDVSTAAFAQLASLGKSPDETATIAERIGNNIKLGDLEIFQARRDQRIAMDKAAKHRAAVNAMQAGGDPAAFSRQEPTDEAALTSQVYQHWLNEIISRYKNTEE